MMDQLCIPDFVSQSTLFYVGQETLDFVMYLAAGFERACGETGAFLTGHR